MPLQLHYAELHVTRRRQFTEYHTGKGKAHDSISWSLFLYTYGFGALQMYFAIQLCSYSIFVTENKSNTNGDYTTFTRDCAI